MSRQRSSPLEVFLAFLSLGCSSFGGPIAHLGYFRSAFVERRQWLTESTYAELIALAQSMPGPASSQVGFATGLLRAGWPGGIAAWTGFTLPSALLMLFFAYGYGLAHEKLLPASFTDCSSSPSPSSHKQSSACSARLRRMRRASHWP